MGNNLIFTFLYNAYNHRKICYFKLSFWLRDYIKLKEKQSFQAKKLKKKLSEIEISIYDDVPDWLENYIQYKFNLLNRTGDGIIEADEFEYTLSFFDIPAKDCRSAFIMLSEVNNFFSKI